MKQVMLTIAVATALAGCAAPKPTANQTSLEIQTVQAKMFETDKPHAFKAVLSVLQDLG